MKRFFSKKLVTQLSGLALIVTLLSAILVPVSIKAASANQQQAFINRLAPDVIKLSKKYRIYGSIQMAQAILESGWGQSDLAQQGNNFFGIKGSYNGSSVKMPTKEYSATKGWYTINAEFKKYPSVYASMEDNADKIRNGLDWDRNFYSGSWPEKAGSYQAAAKALVGKYATSPDYANSLINIIKTYHLDKLIDEKAGISGKTPASYDKVISTKNTNYQAILNQSKRNDGLYTNGAYNTSASVKRAGSGKSMNMENIVVTQEVQTTRATYVRFSLNGKTYWIDKRGVSVLQKITSNRKVKRTATINQSTRNDGVYFYGPYRTSVDTLSADAHGKQYQNHRVTVVQEARVSSGATYAKVQDGLGSYWIDVNALV